MLLLILVERGMPQRMQARELQYISIWPEARTESKPMPKPPPDLDVPQPARLVSADVEQLQQKNVTDDGEPTAMARIDWNAAAVSAAARIAEGAGRKEAFSSAPRALRESCKPRVFDEATKALMAERLPGPSDPDAVGPDPKANCIIVGGFPKCVQKITVKPRPGVAVGDLFKEGRAGRRPASSVPAPDTC